MNMKRIREELQALKEQIASPARVEEPSALQDIEARLDRLAGRQLDTDEQPTASGMAGLATWWRERFGQEITR